MRYASEHNETQLTVNVHKKFPVNICAKCENVKEKFVNDAMKFFFVRTKF